MDLTIEVRYSCRECGLVDIPVKVRAREEEGVITWVAQMVMELGRDHASRSPNCEPRELTRVKIPITGSDKVGGPSVN